MTDETEVATDPRLEQAAPEPETPAPEPEAPEPEIAPEPEPEPEASVEPEPETPPTPKKGKKAVEDILKQRVGHLTKELATQGSAKDQEIARLVAQLEAATALVGGGTPPAAGTLPAPPAGGADRMFTRAELTAEATRIAEQNAFNAQANSTFDAGVEKHGDTFKEAVENLNAVGVMTQQFLEAAFATDAAPDVINHLGEDPEEAARIANLPPIKMAAEMAKLAAKLATPRARQISNAPAPIRPVIGVGNAETDLAKAAEGGDDMSAYAAARLKQGSPWAMTAKQRSMAARTRS